MTDEETRTPVDPYGFVRLVGQPRRLPGVSHHRFEGQSGRLTCQLTTKTPLFIYNPAFAATISSTHERARFPVYRREAVIPGSSLKGVIRSVAEAVEASCLHLFQEHYQGGGITRGQSLTVKTPPGYEKCSDIKQLCPACRLFGMLNRGTVFSGKVSISDARTQPDQYTLMGFTILDVLSTPKPEARVFTYTMETADGTRVPRGRKFYRHRLDGISTRFKDLQDHQNKTVQPLDAGASFTFTVDYADLRDEELRLLLYALALEPTVWHKIGLGKPLGLGSVHIEVTEWTQIDRQARYKTLGGGLAAPLTGDALQAALNDQLDYFYHHPGDNLGDLRELWRYEHNYEIGYQTSYQP